MKNNLYLRQMNIDKGKYVTYRHSFAYLQNLYISTILST